MPLMELTFGPILQSLGEEAVGTILKKIVTQRPDLFKIKITSAAAALEAKYGKNLFGGNMREFLTKPSMIEEFRKLLLPFDHPDLEVIRKEIDLSTLPDTFFPEFRTALFNELSNDPEYIDLLIQNFQALKASEISSNTDGILKNTEEIKSLLSQQIEALKSSRVALTEKSIESILAKPEYVFHYEYIPRLLYHISEDTRHYSTTEVTLVDVCNLKNRILLLSPAGMGKTVEIEKLAEHFSQASDLYPVLIRLNFYSGEDIEYWLNKECSRWSEIPPKKLVLIFDGLDEVHVNHFETAIKKLVAIGQDEKYRHAKLVVACRDNFFNPEFTRHYSNKESFTILRLKELGYRDIVLYVNKSLGIDYGESFLTQVQQKGLFDIINNPFFLKYLIADYQRNRKLPTSKVELFEKLIEHRISRDHERAATLGINLSKKSVLIRAEIERIALIMETNGKNFISESEFQQILPDVEHKRKLVEHSFLFDLRREGKWQFEHNNFQEYLAASSLKNKSLEKIKRLLALPPDFIQIKPTWVNALSFLFLLIPKESQAFKTLLEWLIVSDQELLIRMEKGRLDLAVREKICISILEHYQTKGLSTWSDKFNIRDIGRFISDSLNIFDFIIPKLRESRSPMIVSELTGVLEELEYIDEYRDILVPILEGHILSGDSGEICKYHYFHILAKRKWHSVEFFNAALKQPILIQGRYERAGVYTYLLESPFLDQNTDLIVAMAAHHMPDQPELDVEIIYRDECFKAIKSASGIATVLKFFASVHSSSSGDILVRNLLPEVLQNATSIYVDGNSVLHNAVLNSFTGFVETYLDEYTKVFKDFFEKTHSTQRVCMEFYIRKDNALISFHVLALLADEQFIHFLMDEFKGERIDDQIVRQLLSAFRMYGADSAHNLFYTLINDASGNRFVYPPYPNWVEIFQKRKTRDLDLILDRSEFIRRIETIFRLEGTQTLTKEHLLHFRKVFMRHNEDPFDNNISVKALSNFDVPVSLETALEYFSNDNSWEWFQVHTLLKFDVEDQIALTDREITFIKNWCDKTLVQSDFGNTYSYPHIYLAYFIWRFDFPYSNEVYLNLLWVYGSHLPQKKSRLHGKLEMETLIDWLEHKVSEPGVSKKVLENLRSGITTKSVLSNHILLANKYKISAALPKIAEYLKANSLTGYSLVNAIKQYLDLGGDVAIGEVFLVENQSLEENDKANLMEMLSDYKSKMIKFYLKQKLQTNEPEDKKLMYAKLLMKSGDVIGLTYYREWVVSNRRFHGWINGKHLGAVPAEEALPELMRILEASVQLNFQLEDLRGQDLDLIYVMNEIAVTSEVYFKMVRDKYLQLIDEYQANSLRYQIKVLERSYYTRGIREQSLEQIIELVDRI